MLMTLCVRVCDSKPQFANLVTHPGFSDQLCYGDISLRFMYTWSEMSKRDRELILRQNHGLRSPTISQELKHSQNVTNTTAQWVVNELALTLTASLVNITFVQWVTWVSRVLAFHSTYFSNLWDKSFQAFDCSNNDNQTQPNNAQKTNTMTQTGPS